MGIIPSKSQWGKWSLPAKAGYIGVWIAIIGIPITLLSNKISKQVDNSYVTGDVVGRDKITYQQTPSNPEETTTLLFSKVAAADVAANGNLIIQMLLANKSEIDIQLMGTSVHLINLPVFKEQGVINIVKESRIDYETILLSKLSETTYDFSITNDAFEKIKSGELAILSKTKYSDHSGSQRMLYLVTHYGKMRNTLASYKLWHE
jgi:hypothetical protein